MEVTPHSKRGGNENLVDAYGAGSVKQVPEPVSPRYRSRVSEVSWRYRSHSGKHEPKFHTSTWALCPTGRRSAERSPRTIPALQHPDQGLFGGDDGTRTRDPLLAKVAEPNVGESPRTIMAVQGQDVIVSE